MRRGKDKEPYGKTMDIGIYLPSSFGASRKEQKSIVALQPTYDRLLEGSRTVASEDRLLGVDIISMVNITPFFKANPTEAYGEQMNVLLITEIRKFLAQEENVNLQDRVAYAEAGDVDWAWMPKDDQAVRGAALAYECRVRVPRI